MTVGPHPRALEGDDVLSGCVVEIAGMAIQLGASDPHRADAVASLFRHAAPSVEAARAVLYFGDGDPGLPPCEPATHAGGVELRRCASGRLWIRSPEGLTAQSAVDEIRIDGDADALARVFRHVCLIALGHLLAQHRRYMMHAAAVVADGGSFLVLGDTGTGKSTLAFAAHRLGWPVLADDAVVVHQLGGRAVAEGVPRPISVPHDVIADGEVDGRPVPNDIRNRTELPIGTLTSKAVPVVAVLVTTQSGAAGPKVDSISGHEVLRLALRASVLVTDREARPAVFAIAGTLARLPAWSLTHGPDPAYAVAEVTQQLNWVRGLLHPATDSETRSR